ADVRAENITYHEGSCRFTVSSKAHKNIDITLKLPGVHNIQNALAAIAVAWETGVATPLIAEALSSFEGIARRFQIYPDLMFKGQSILMVDDYAHHPNEISAAFQAVRSSWPDKRLVVAFQPHRYSRTRDLFDDFSRVLSESDILVLSDVYPAGEAHIAGADGKSLSRSIRQRGIITPIYIDSMNGLPETLLVILQEGDILLTLGAGDIGRVASELPSQLFSLTEKGGAE
ncbi:MAG: UDP-N-acetylmuramate--L-alanine ligase, partial [Gammaproteobacteria bacterium]|nr:UDP-N-acetylmuramate--L-alanine ligase [Gammaproteobacteria bacterium]